MNPGVAEPGEVLAWWFGDAARDPAAAAGRGSLWFGAEPAVDAEIRRRFAGTVAAAAGGALDEWNAGPEGCLALVVVLDQFPRNLYRGTPAAFEHDPRALAFSEAAVGRGLVARLTPPQQVFLLMPYQHAESRTVQRRSIALLEAVAQRAATEWKALMDNFARYARDHAAIVERFGRFPHRNTILGRRSTEDEQAYLSTRHPSFGQS